MRRNTLEAVFGALGAGLTGYGREKRERDEAAERRKRESDLMRVQMLGMGFDPEGDSTRRSQGMAQAGQLAQAAAPAPVGMPNMSAVGRALLQASQDVPSGRSITVGGERFVQPLSRMPETIAKRRAEEGEAREIRGEERALKSFEEQERIRGERTQQEIRQRTLSPQDRVFQAVLQFARTPIQGEFGMDSRMPTEDEIREFAKTAGVAQQAVYKGVPASAGGTSAQRPVSAEEWMRSNPKRGDEDLNAYRRRYQAAFGAR